MWPWRRVALARPVIALARPVAHRIGARSVPALAATRTVTFPRWLSSPPTLGSYGHLGKEDSNELESEANSNSLWESEANSNLPDGLSDEDIKNFMLGEWDPPRKYNPPRRFLYKLQRQLEVYDLWPLPDRNPTTRLQHKKWLLAAVHRLAAQDAFNRTSKPMDEADTEPSKEVMLKLRYQKAAARKMLTVLPPELDCEPEVLQEKQDRKRAKQIAINEQRHAARGEYESRSDRAAKLGDFDEPRDRAQAALSAYQAFQPRGRRPRSDEQRPRSDEQRYPSRYGLMSRPEMRARLRQQPLRAPDDVDELEEEFQQAARALQQPQRRTGGHGPTRGGRDGRGRNEEEARLAQEERERYWRERDAR